MTLRSNDLQSDSDLDSIRNSCDVLEQWWPHKEAIRRQNILLLYLMIEITFFLQASDDELNEVMLLLQDDQKYGYLD